MNNKGALTFLLVIIFYTNISSQSTPSIWNLQSTFEDRESMIQLTPEMPTKYQASHLTNVQLLEKTLLSAPIRFSVQASSEKVELTLPMPNGKMENFTIQNSPVMESELAALYPKLQTYTAYSTQHSYKTAKISITPHGMFVMIRGDIEGMIFIRPYSLTDQLYYSFYAKDLPARNQTYECKVTDEISYITDTKRDHPLHSRSGDCQLRQYRLALACTGEYAQLYNDGDDSNGDIVSDALSNMVIMMNQVNGVYEQDLGITMIIINETANIIFTDPDNDPYTNDDTNLMLSENAVVCENVIGNSNFDIGHVFASGGGGRAFLKSPCTSNKARGTSKADGPLGDQADLKTAAHEFGHQFGARHTQNNDCFRSLSTSYEPGSGSTIMGYAGICPPLVQSYSDIYFHTISIEQITDFVTNNGNSCATILNIPNQAPTANAGMDYTIPISTPFLLTGLGTDPDGDQITYTWEQYDREFAPMPPKASSTEGPSFRSYLPSINPTRYFPSLDILAGIKPGIWEVLPNISRALRFKLTVRDNNERFGCPMQDEMMVFVDDRAGPFKITYPSTDSTWIAGDTEILTWNVAGTDLAPFDCSTVDIYYSTDGGLTFPNELDVNVPNSGSYPITVPDEASAFVKFMIKCSDNIFFATSTGNISIGREEICTKFYSTDTPIQISSTDATSITSQINVDLDKVISNFRVIDMKGLHSYMGDLRFTLIDPTEKELFLLGQKCGVSADFDITFDDGGDRFSCPLNDGDITTPTEPLRNYIGTNAGGLWSLNIEDIASGDGGELSVWGLEICYTEDLVSADQNISDNMEIKLSPNPASTELKVEIQTNNTFQGSMQVLDIHGHLLQQIDLLDPKKLVNHTFQLEDWATGVYLIRFISIKGTQRVEKFVKY